VLEFLVVSVTVISATHEKGACGMALFEVAAETGGLAEGDDESKVTVFV